MANWLIWFLLSLFFLFSVYLRSVAALKVKLMMRRPYMQLVDQGIMPRKDPFYQFDLLHSVQHPNTRPFNFFFSIAVFKCKNWMRVRLYSYVCIYISFFLSAVFLNSMAWNCVNTILLEILQPFCLFIFYVPQKLEIFEILSIKTGDSVRKILKLIVRERKNSIDYLLKSTIHSWFLINWHSMKSYK